MRAADLLRWIAIVTLWAVTVFVYRPTFDHTSSGISLNCPPPGTIAVAPFPCGYETFALAKSIANRHGFSNPFDTLPTGPSAHTGPLYPAYLALIIGVFGHGSTAVGVILWAAALILAVQLMLLPLLAQHFGLGFWTGVLAALAWLAATIPPTFDSESQLVGLVVVAAAFFMGSSFTLEMTASQLLMSGILWGALLLLQPVVILVLPFWVLLLHFQSPSSRRQKIALGILPIILVTPWIVRNFVVFHKPVFIRDNLGLELAISNNECASSSFHMNEVSGCFSQVHPNENYAEALKVRQLGEVEYNRVRLREAMQWIKGNPMAFTSLSLRRFEAFWLPPASANPGDGVILHPWVVDCLTLLSVAGLVLMWRNARVGAFVVGLWLIFFPLIYYFVQFFQRYRFPILWASFLPGCYFITKIAEGIFSNRTTSRALPMHANTALDRQKAGCHT